MASRKGKRRKRKKAQPFLGRGLDFGIRPRILFASESAIDFNNHLIESKVFGFAYGSDRIEGYPVPIACLSFIAERPELLAKAFACFEHWGCQADGDAVDITIILKRNGEYLFGVSPNFERFLYRMTKDTSFISPIFTGLTWIKHVDTTNPILWQWKNLLSSRMFPIQIHAATAGVENNMPKINTVQMVKDVKPFIKFDLTILSEDEEPDHPFLRIERDEKSHNSGPKSEKPRDIAVARRKALNAVFPVTLFRLHGQGLIQQCRAVLPSTVSDAQIEQAAINVILSREWTGGENHYESLADLHDVWWKRLKSRIEDVQVPVPALDFEAIIMQLQLDVTYVLRSRGIQVSDRFSVNQGLFARLGYASTP